MLKKLLMASAAAGVASFATSAEAAFISIDEFNGPDMVIQIQTGSVTLTDNQMMDGFPSPGAAGGSIIGSYRDMTTTVFTNPNPTPPPFGLETKALISMAGGTFTHSQDSGVDSTTSLVYNGLAGAGLAANFSAYQGLEIGLISADAGVDWRFSFVDGDGSVFELVQPTGAVNSPATLFLSFADFNYVGGGDAVFNLGNIFSFTLEANVNGATTSFDTTVDYLRVVPEPMSVALFGLGLLGAGMVRRRKAA